MASLTLRSVKAAPLTNNEIDTNFTNLNDDVQTRLLATAYTAADVLLKLKTVDGSGSGLDSDLLDGMTTASANTPSTVVSRDSSGNFSAGTITAFLNGNVLGNVTGTVTNGVVTTGSYANPTWITSLAGSKVTSIPNTSLTNSTITINGNVVSLGGSVNINSSDITWSGVQTFLDDRLTIADNIDISKKLQFQISNISANTTRILTAPNESGIIATHTHVSSITNPLDSKIDYSVNVLNARINPIEARVNALVTAKGYISFHPASGGVYASNKLSIARNGVGSYTIYLDPSIQTGNEYYAPLVGAVDDGNEWGDTSYSPGYMAIQAISTQNISASNFLVRSIKRYNSSYVQGGGNDANWISTFAAFSVDPNRITVVVY